MWDQFELKLLQQCKWKRMSTNLFQIASWKQWMNTFLQGLALWPVTFVHKMPLLPLLSFVISLSLDKGQRAIKVKVDDKTSNWWGNTEYYSQIINHNLRAIQLFRICQSFYTTYSNRLHSIATFVLESHQRVVWEKTDNL